jgi:putative flippase GtrA
MQTNSKNYLLVGLWNALFGFTIFFLLTEYLFQERHQFNLLLTFAISTPQAHFSQRKLVWKSNAIYWKELSKYTISSLSLYALNATLLEVFVKVFELPVVISQLLSLTVIVVLTYLSHAKYVFTFERNQK